MGRGWAWRSASAGRRIGLLVLTLCIVCISITAAPSPLAFIDTRLGGGGFGFQAGSLNPGPQAPWSACRVGPDTSLGPEGIALPFQHFGGYSYGDTHIRRFTHTHLVGAGVGDLGNFGLIPYGRRIPDGSTIVAQTGFADSKFSHEDEEARAGYYAVTLDDPNVRAELTAIGTMSAAHRYAFHPRTTSAPDAVMLFDACASIHDNSKSNACKSADVAVDLSPPSSPLGVGYPPNSISISSHILMSGSLTSRSSRRGGLDIYFHARAWAVDGQTDESVTMKSGGIWNDGVVDASLSRSSTSSGSLGAIFDWGDAESGTIRSGESSSRSVNVTIYGAISFINASMAELNLDTQLQDIQRSASGALSGALPLPTFEEIRAAAEAQWLEVLSVAQVTPQPRGNQHAHAAEGKESSLIELASSIRHTASNDAPTFDLLVFVPNDTSCTHETVQPIPLRVGECVKAPPFPSAIWSPFASFLLVNVSQESGEYWLELYGESSDCDDFPTWAIKSTVGHGSELCQRNPYWNSLVVVESSSASKHHALDRETRPGPSHESIYPIATDSDSGMDEEKQSSIFDKQPEAPAVNRRTHSPPLNAGDKYLIEFFGSADGSCSSKPTTSMPLAVGNCTLSPSQAWPFASFRLASVDPKSGTYQMAFFKESPLCDDFPMWSNNETLGKKKENCAKTPYFNFQVSAVTDAHAHAHVRASRTSLMDGTRQRSSATPSESYPGLVQFYTFLYHSFLAPTSYVEAKNLYLGFDGLVHEWTFNHSISGRREAPKSHYMSDMSLWDTHRTQHPLLSLFAPHTTLDISRSLMTMYEQGGDIPRWPLANIYTECMIGSHGMVSMSEWMSKGLFSSNADDPLGIPLDRVFEAMKTMVDTPRKHAGRKGLDEYVAQGFVPFEVDKHATSLTLEYALDDWAVAQVAQMLGEEFREDAVRLFSRSKNYRNMWNASMKLMCPRSSSGEFHCPSKLESMTPYPIDTGYTEADAIQQSYFVPHDVEGLISLYPSPDDFISTWTSFMSSSFDWIFRRDELPNPFYWAGNEPSLFIVWMAAYAQRPDLVQKWSRELLSKRYGATPDIALPGNDDYGTLSAWATWASLGLYPQAGSDIYILGSPLFPQVTILRPEAYGGPLQIIAHHTSDRNVYVREVRLNGERVLKPFLKHSQLNGKDGSGVVVLEFFMTDQPTFDAFPEMIMNGL